MVLQPLLVAAQTSGPLARLPTAVSRDRKEMRSTQIPNIEVECWGRLSVTITRRWEIDRQRTRAQRLSAADQRQLPQRAIPPGVV